jgi:hypothetical protein
MDKKILLDFKDNFLKKVVVTRDDDYFRNIEIQELGDLIEENISRGVIVHLQHK